MKLSTRLYHVKIYEIADIRGYGEFDSSLIVKPLYDLRPGAF